MRFLSLLLTSFPLLAAAANPCAPATRVPGTPIEAPHAVFEAYVVEVHAPQASPSTFGVLRTRRALVEVSRSFHGPYSPGQQVETLTIEGVERLWRCLSSRALTCWSRRSLAARSRSSNCCPKAQVVPQDHSPRWRTPPVKSLVTACAVR